MRKLLILLLLIPSLCYGDGWFYSVPSGAAPAAATTTLGPYELGSLNVDSHTGNTAIVDDALNGGGPAGDWTGFVVEITAGTGSGSATITGWDDGTDTVTVGAGLTDVADNDTFKIRCEYQTLSSSEGDGNIQDAYVISSAPDNHASGDETLRCENDTGTPHYCYPLWYVNFIAGPIDASDTINSASLYCYITSVLWAPATDYDIVVGKLIDGSASPDATVWSHLGLTQAAGGATYNNRDETPTVEWEADAGAAITDVIPSAVESPATTILGSADSTWASWNIASLVTDWVTDGDNNIGFYMRNTEADGQPMYVGSQKNSTTSYRWFIVVEYQ